MCSLVVSDLVEKVVERVMECSVSYVEVWVCPFPPVKILDLFLIFHGGIFNLDLIYGLLIGACKSCNRASWLGPQPMRNVPGSDYRSLLVSPF